MLVPITDAQKEEFKRNQRSIYDKEQHQGPTVASRDPEKVAVVALRRTSCYIKGLPQKWRNGLQRKMESKNQKNRSSNSQFRTRP